tara:strand:- start:14521 stop:14814 length:294 start_codon:yes stop_codon:yes gene_type:complete
MTYRFKKKEGMTEIDTYAMVEVTWIDPVSDSSWLSKEELLSMKPGLCKTTGRVLKKDRYHIRIFGDWQLDDEGENISSVGNVTVIPNVLIKDIKVIK